MMSCSTKPSTAARRRSWRRGAIGAVPRARSSTRCPSMPLTPDIWRATGRARHARGSCPWCRLVPHEAGVDSWSSCLRAPAATISALRQNIGAGRPFDRSRRRVKRPGRSARLSVGPGDGPLAREKPLPDRRPGSDIRDLASRVARVLLRVRLSRTSRVGMHGSRGSAAVTMATGCESAILPNRLTRTRGSRFGWCRRRRRRCVPDGTRSRRVHRDAGRVRHRC